MTAFASSYVSVRSSYDVEGAISRGHHIERVLRLSAASSASTQQVNSVIGRIDVSFILGKNQNESTSIAGKWSKDKLSVRP